jgi:hypothetical protein
MIRRLNLFDNIRSSMPQKEKPSLIVQPSNSLSKTNIQLDSVNNDSDWVNLNQFNNNESLMDSQRKQSDHSLILDEDGNLLFYYYDAFEDVQLYPGMVLLFGKVID